MAMILIVDDDLHFCAALTQAMQYAGFETLAAHTLREGIEKARAACFDAVMLDVRMPDGRGLDLIPAFRASPGGPEVIIVTGNGDPEGAELAIKSGAWDYIEKPASLTQMTLPVVRALEFRRQREECRSLRARSAPLRREGLVGESPSFAASLELLAEAAAGESGVLITGETGTGKEMFSQAIHANSARRSGPFVVVDCAALPDSLVESVLFGHVRGSFTGAAHDRTGLIREAHGGTLFLDEIGELPLSVQKSFLRVLQERRFRPIGGSQEVASDFRLVSATNRDLDAMVRAGAFREDLLFRIKGLTIELPPLRARREDIRLLARHAIDRVCERMGIGSKGVSPDFMEALEEHDWPGNVRELLSTIEKAVISARWEAMLYPLHLPPDLRVRLIKGSLRASGAKRREPQPPAREDREAPAQPAAPWKDYKQRALEEAERRYFGELHASLGGNVREMARISELTPARIYGLLKKHGIGS